MKCFHTRVSNSSCVHIYIASLLCSYIPSPYVMFTLNGGDKSLVRKGNNFPKLCISSLLMDKGLSYQLVIRTWVRFCPHKSDHFPGTQVRLYGWREDVSPHRHSMEVAIAITLGGHSHHLWCLNCWVWHLEISAQAEIEYKKDSFLIAASVLLIHFLTKTYDVEKQTSSHKTIIDFSFVYWFL